MRATNIFALIALMTLTACTNDLSMREAQRAQIKNVAVISALGDDLQHVRATLLSLPKRESERVDWKFDETVAATIRERLAHQWPLLNIVEVQYDPNELSAQIYKEVYKESWTTEFYSDPARASSALRSIVANTQADTIILITRGAGTVQDQCFYGVGLLTEGHLTSFSPTFLSLCLTVAVLDAVSLDALERKNSKSYEAYNGGGIFGPTNPAPFPANFQLPLNEEQKHFLQPKYRFLLQRDTKKLMERIGF